MKSSAIAPTSPRTVTRGESSPQLPVCIDYLNVSVPSGNVKLITHQVARMLGVESTEARKAGAHGFTHSIDLGGYGLIAYGGESQRGAVLVSINGAGCARVADFAQVGKWFQSQKARITRVDIAADDHGGKVFSVRGAIAGWRRGQFTAGGNKPNSRLVDDLGSGNGCTLYVGSRDAGKLARVYEKAKQLGDKLGKWVRAEVELHAKDRVLPWEILCDPARFLSGTYPFFSRLALISERIKTFKAGAQVTLTRAAKWAREVTGKTIFVMLKANGGDMGDVCNKLMRVGVPKRLKHWYDKSGMSLAAMVPA